MIEDALGFLSEGYTDEVRIAEETSRTLGLSALEVLDERERRKEILSNLKIILSCLSENQRQVLLLTASGNTVKQIEEETGIDNSNVSKVRRSISTTLRAHADESRIQSLADDVVRLAKTSRGRHSKLYNELCAELDERFDVREALKKLFVLLQPRTSQKEMPSKVVMPAYPYERAKDVGIGMREGILDGYKVMKTVTKCTLPEYFKQTDCPSDMTCTICAVCSRKKDVYGRRDNGKWGFSKAHEELQKAIAAERKAVLEEQRATGELAPKNTREWEMVTMESFHPMKH